jgi:hypothetical protein
VAAARIGLVSDATRNTVSRVIGSPPIVRFPATATSVRPCRDTSATAPGSASGPHAASTMAWREVTPPPWQRLKAELVEVVGRP